jgi:hypothetical protein
MLNRLHDEYAFNALNLFYDLPGITIPYFFVNTLRAQASYART